MSCELTECFLNYERSLNFPWMFIQCFCNVHWMFLECSLNVPWIYIYGRGLYSPTVHSQELQDTPIESKMLRMRLYLWNVLSQYMNPQWLESCLYLGDRSQVAGCDCEVSRMTWMVFILYKVRACLCSCSCSCSCLCLCVTITSLSQAPPPC
jgi:hypothetical protein